MQPLFYILRRPLPTGSVLLPYPLSIHPVSPIYIFYRYRAYRTSTRRRVPAGTLHRLQSTFIRGPPTLFTGFAKRVSCGAHHLLSGTRATKKSGAHHQRRGCAPLFSLKTATQNARPVNRAGARYYIF